MKGKSIGWIVVLAIVGIFLIVAFTGQRSLVKSDEGVTAAWANVNTEYEKRYALIDNLVETVKGAANFEKETLTQVVEARAKATSVNFTTDQLTPENIAKFEQVQNNMQGALSRLLVSVERYPELKANQNFLQLQNTVEKIEGEIGISRRQYNEAVRVHNVKVRSFPGNIIAGLFGFDKKEPFKATQGAENAPKIKF